MDGGKESLVKLFEEYKSSKDWKVMSEDKGIIQEMRNVGDRIAIRSTCTADVDFQKFAEYIQNGTTTLDSDPMCEAEIVLEQKEDYGISHLKFKGIFPVAARDFIIRHYNIRQDNSVLVVAASCDFPVAPDSGTVRASLTLGGTFVQKLQKGVRVTYISDSDLKGSLPGFVKNMISKQQGQNSQGLVNAFLKKKGK